MSTSTQELLESFDLLPDSEKREVASEIIRRAFALDRKVEIDEASLAALYAGFADEDRGLAEDGLEDYRQSLAAEDAR
jgi:hypothetical protein